MLHSCGLRVFLYKQIIYSKRVRIQIESIDVFVFDIE